MRKLQYIRGSFWVVDSTTRFTDSNNLMHGWFDEDKIELSIPKYMNILFSFVTD